MKYYIFQKKILKKFLQLFFFKKIEKKSLKFFFLSCVRQLRANQ